jgi:hypothetical protein
MPGLMDGISNGSNKKLSAFYLFCTSADLIAHRLMVIALFFLVGLVKLEKEHAEKLGQCIVKLSTLSGRMLDHQALGRENISFVLH